MIYSKTELGQTALHNRALVLTPRQRSSFILFDGKRSVDDVLKMTASLGVTSDDVAHLLELGLLSEAATTPPPVAAMASLAEAKGQGPDQDSQDHYSKAYPIATRLTAELGLRGFRLNLAVEAAGDLTKLRELAPKIREAVGPGKFQELEAALYS